MKKPFPTSRLKMPKAFLPVLALLLGLPAIGTAADPAKPAVKPALSVNAIVPETMRWPVRLAAQGSIAAWQEASIGTETGGLRLTELHASVGDRVHKGQELARLFSDTVAAELAQTRASLTEAEATFAEARANAERARQTGAEALSPQQLTQYLTGEQTAAARVEALKARLEADTIRLAQTHILAPDDGTISQRSATLGSVMQSGQELFRLIRRDRLEWRAELPAADLVRLRPGLKASILTAGNRRIAGRIRTVAPTIDAQTRNGLVYIDLLENADARPGMFARGEIEQGEETVLTLPQRAVILRDGFTYAYRIGVDNRLIETKLVTGQRNGDRIAILAGLDAGARVAAAGVGFLADGDLVRVVPAPQPATKQ